MPSSFITTSPLHHEVTKNTENTENTENTKTLFVQNILRDLRDLRAFVMKKVAE
jgi:hypothetical protein